MRVRLSAFLLAGISSIACGDELPEVKALQSGMPQDVSSFISRVAECNHWGGEEPYDKERAEFISKAVDNLRCSKLEADEKYLRGKYQDKSKILNSIQKSKGIYW